MIIMISIQVAESSQGEPSRADEPRKKERSDLFESLGRPNWTRQTSCSERLANRSSAGLLGAATCCPASTKLRQICNCVPTDRRRRRPPGRPANLRALRVSTWNFYYIKLRLSVSSFWKLSNFKSYLQVRSRLEMKKKNTKIIQIQIHIRRFETRKRESRCGEANLLLVLRQLNFQVKLMSSSSFSSSPPSS